MLTKKPLGGLICKNRWWRKEQEAQKSRKKGWANFHESMLVWQQELLVLRLLLWQHKATHAKTARVPFPSFHHKRLGGKTFRLSLVFLLIHRIFFSNPLSSRRTLSHFWVLQKSKRARAHTHGRTDGHTVTHIKERLEGKDMEFVMLRNICYRGRINILEGW